MESNYLIVPRRRPAARWLSRLVVASVAIACLAFTVRQTIDIMQWRDAGSVARAVAADPISSERERLEAQVVMRRDISAGILLLRKNAEIDGQVGQGARNALLVIQADLK